MASLPLFPLGTVLMPGARLPLQVFEPRYVALLAHVIEGEDPLSGFGVVSIRQGWEVGERENELHAVGCFAALDRVVEISAGLFVLLSHGTRRFRVTRLDEAAGTLWTTADVTWLDDARGDELAPYDRDDAARVAIGLLKAVESYCGTAGLEQPKAPDDVELLPYWAAQVVDLDRGDQQRLLEAPDVPTRLSMARRMVQRETALAASLGVTGGTGAAPPSLN